MPCIPQAPRRVCTGTCTFCNQKAGILSREHPECRRTFQAGWNEMVRLARVRELEAELAQRQEEG